MVDIKKLVVSVINGINNAYKNLILATQPTNLIQYFPMNEQTGTVATDSSSEKNNGTYAEALLGQNGYPNNNKSVYFSGASTSKLTAVSTAFKADFNTAEGSFHTCVKLGELWSVTTERIIMYVYTDANNKIRIRKSNSNRLVYEYVAGGTSNNRTVNLSNEGFFRVGITWSKSNDRVRVYLNGVQIGPDMTGLGTWSGAVSVWSIFGTWIGYGCHAATWKAELTPAEMLALGQGYEESPEVLDGFSVAIMPDPQNYAAYTPFEYYAQTQWIVDNKTKYDIQAVLCTGDLVDTCSTSAQWVVADAAFDILDTAEIPYLASIGNHDWDSEKDATTFNANFPTTRYSTHGWWSGGFKDAGHSENAYFLLTIGAVDYIFISVEDSPPEAVLTWLDGLLTTHSTKKAVIITHSYLGTIGAGENNARNTQGNNIWAKVKLHDNVIWIESGHVVSNGYGRLVSLSDGGKEVNQVMANYQIEDGASGGCGYMRLVTFDVADGKIYTQTFSPTRKKLKKDDNHKFTLNYPA